MNDTKYNGWTNYATWRVNLEMFAGFDPREHWPDPFDTDDYDLGDLLKGFAEEIIEDTSPEGLARDYALAFLNDVNWLEIASHMIADYAEETETN